MTSQRHSDDALLDAARDCVVEVGVRRTTLTDIAKRAGVSRMTLYRRFPDVRTLVRALMTREFGALLRRADEVAADRPGAGELDGSSPGVSGAGVSGAGVSGAGVSGAGVSGAGVSGAGVSGAGVSGAGVSGAGAPGAEGGNARERLVRRVITGVRLLAADPLMRRVLDLDAELMLPYLVQRLGDTQRLVEAFLLAQVEAGHADGSVRPGDAAAQARLVLLTAQSMVLSVRPATTDLDFDDLLAELAAFLDGALS